MYGALKIIHHKHTASLQPHEHTSYATLLALLAIVGAALVFFTGPVSADDPPPQAGSVSLTGSVPSAPPQDAAVITSPQNGQHFNSSPVTVSGTCPKETLVEIYKSDIFAGSTPCDSNGKFSIDIDPLFGQNILTARVYDVLNQAGPVSKPVTIYYDYSVQPAAGASSLDLSGLQFLLETDSVFRGSFPKQQMNVPITVIGGTPPFAINVQWGDSTNQVISRGNNSTFNASHAYKKPGTFKITIQGSDSKQLYAFLSVAAIINGQPEVVAPPANTATSKALVLWPFFAILVTAVISFWVGEKREKKLLKAGERPENDPFASAAPPPPPAKPTATS